MKKLVLLLLLFFLSGCVSTPKPITISFQPNNGETIADIVTEAGKEVLLPTPTRVGYVFNGWQSPDGIHENTAVFDTDTILYARWTIESYTVTFIDFDDAVLSTQQVRYREEATAPSIPVRSGYSFTGWSQGFDEITSATTIQAQYEVATVGLEYTLDIDHYEVSGYNGTDVDVIIPSKVNALPVTIVGIGAFEGNTLVERVQLPSSITLIDDRAFYECINLSIINIPAAVELIGERAFYGAQSLISVTIPTPVIGSSAFYYCSHLSNIELLDTVTTLSDSVFLGCADLVTIYLPSSITTIENHAFSWCRALTTIYTSEDNVSNIQSMLSSITLIYSHKDFHVEAGTRP
jgi:uncharacterized repeat protein (TIGR02543 family)